MHRLVLLIFFLGVSLVGTAQTRRIAHRAHSGSQTEHYDGRDGNYGNTPMNPYPPNQPRVVLKADTVQASGGRDSIIYNWDTLQPEIKPRVNEASHKPIHRLKQLGYICSPATVQ